MRSILAIILIFAALFASGCSVAPPTGIVDEIVAPSAPMATPSNIASTAAPATKASNSNAAPPKASLQPTDAAAAQPDVTSAWQLKGERNISTWAAYWDIQDVINEIAPYADKLEALCYFEVFFAPDGSLIMPDALPEIYSIVENVYKRNLWDSYVTFVNDVRDDDNGGVFDLKTPDILAGFFKDEASIDAHVEQLIDFTIENGFDGIEIDYEAIRKSPELWTPFTQFITKLFTRTEETGLLLRVVLEPNTPFDEYEFPKGPTYVIMCYNLHGGHSGEGPKADYAFLTKLIEEGAALPGRRIYALATGGYDWAGNTDATQVTLKAAYKLFSASATDATVRDQNSGALNFHYKDGDGRTHSVWFADSRTLSDWTDHLRKSGFDIAYWRLGGNYID